MSQRSAVISVLFWVFILLLAILTSVVAPALISLEDFHWRMSLIFGGTVSIILLVIGFLFWRDKGREHKRELNRIQQQLAEKENQK